MQRNEEQVHYQKVLEELDVAIVAVVASSREVVFVNKKALEMFGGDQETVASRVSKILSESGGALPPETGGEAQVDGRLLGYTIYPMDDGEMWILLKDITEKRRLRRLADTMTLMQSIESVFAGLLHELGNPLNGIKTAITLLRRDMSRMSPDAINEFLDRILNEVGRMESLLRTMRAFNTVDDIQIEVIDVRQVVETVHRIFHPTFSMRGVHITVRWHEQNTRVYANQIALQQVLINLITNAIDALEGQLNPTVQIIVYRQDDTLFVEVSDNGPGIAKEALEQIFLPFYTTKSGGTGLGLALVKKLLASMGASITATSDGHHGTMMTVALPAVENT